MSKVNNMKASNLAMSSFKDKMDSLVNENSLPVLESTVEQTATTATTTALQIFDNIATMGKRSLINRNRKQLVIDLDKKRARYVKGALNMTMWIGCLRDNN